MPIVIQVSHLTMKIIKASEFKAKSLQLMNEVFGNGWTSQRCCPATLWWMVRLN